jgi:hypothetical protein
MIMHYNASSSVRQHHTKFQALAETLCNTDVVVMELGETIEMMKGKYAG